MRDTADVNITVAELGRQFERARISWPFIEAFEQSYGLPPFLLYAVGSRETNLTDEVGDGGHGRGVWQLDDRSHTIPDPFPVALQAQNAAQMLRGLLDHFSGHREAAVAAYNAGVGGVERALGRGQPADTATTGGDYSADVLARMEFLQRSYAPHPTPQPEPPKDDDMPHTITLTDPVTQGTWTCRLSDGAVYPDAGAPFLGGYNGHPEWGPKEPVTDFALWKDDDGKWGYKIITEAADAPHFYRFPRSGALA